MKSNGLNMGLTIRSLVFESIAPHNAGGYHDIAWLLAMTVMALARFAVSQDMKKIDGTSVIAAYFAFVARRMHLSL